MLQNLEEERERATRGTKGTRILCFLCFLWLDPLNFISRISDLRCRIRPISKSPLDPSISKAEPSIELNHSLAPRSTCLAKCSTVDTGCNIREIQLVKRIQHVCPKLQFHVLLDRKVLAQR